jgi:hypothetical protein
VAILAQGPKGRVPKNMFILFIKSWIFTHYQKQILVHGFMWSNFSKSWIFSLLICKFHNIGVFDQDPIALKQFLLHSYLSKDEHWAIIDQLHLEGVSKSAKEMERASNFYDFWMKNFNENNDPQKKIFMFECYNLINQMEWGAVYFGVDVQEGQFKILIFDLFFLYPKFNSFFFILYSWFLQLCQKLPSFVKITRDFRG